MNFISTFYCGIEDFYMDDSNKRYFEVVNSKRFVDSLIGIQKPQRIESKYYYPMRENNLVYKTGNGAEVFKYQTAFINRVNNKEKPFEYYFKILYEDQTGKWFHEESGKDVPKRIIIKFLDLCLTIIREYLIPSKVGKDFVYTCLADYLLHKADRIDIHNEELTPQTLETIRNLVVETMYFDITKMLPAWDDSSESASMLDEYEKISNVGHYNKAGMLQVLALADAGNVYAAQAAGSMFFYGLLDGKRNFGKAFSYHYRAITAGATGQSLWSAADMLYHYEDYSKMSKETFPLYYYENSTKKVFNPCTADDAAERADTIVKLLILAYDRGSANAANLAGQIIDDKDFPEDSKSKLTDIHNSAKEWYQVAAEGGCIFAMNRMYEILKETEPDKAEEWLKKGADMYEPSMMNKYVRFLVSQDTHASERKEQAKKYLKKLLTIEKYADYYSGVLTMYELKLDVADNVEKVRLLDEAIECVKQQYAMNHSGNTLDFLDKLLELKDENRK